MIIIPFQSLDRGYMAVIVFVVYLRSLTVRET